jgi:hypothetical protein
LAAAQALDLVEEHGASARILDFHVGRDRSTPTELRLQIFAPPVADEGARMSAVLKEIGALAASMGVAISVDSESSHIHAAVNTFNPKLGIVKQVASPMKRVLVLGSGFVSAPLVEYLLRRPGNHVTVASMIRAEAEALAAGRSRVHVEQLDVFKVRGTRGERGAEGGRGGVGGDGFALADCRELTVPPARHAVQSGRQQ